MGITNPIVQAASYPPLQRTQGRGTHCSGTGMENTEAWATRQSKIPHRHVNSTSTVVKGQVSWPTRFPAFSLCNAEVSEIRWMKDGKLVCSDDAKGNLQSKRREFFPQNPFDPIKSGFRIVSENEDIHFA